MKTKMLVYIAGPLTVGDVDQNIKNAFACATDLLSKGFNVHIPHLTMYLERYWQEPGVMGLDFEYDDWLDMDYAILKRCDVLYRMEGESVGADREVAFAMGAKIPVFDDIIELGGYANDRY